MKNPTAPSVAAPGSSSAERSPVRHLPIGAEEQGQRLDKALARLLPGVPRSRLFRLIRRGEVRVNGRRASPEQRLALGDTLRVPPVRDALGVENAQPGGGGHVPARLIERIERSVLYEDSRMLVLDKPAGVAVHGGSGVSFGIIEALRASRPKETLELAHRLDRDTSGVLLIARRSSALRTLHALLREGRVQKRYLVLVAGRWQLGHRRVEAPLRTDLRVGGERTVRVQAGGKQALTEFTLIEQFPSAALLEATLHTGRTHQIRVHAAYCGHPVGGDEKYGDPSFNTALASLGLKRMFLHAHSVSFAWPDGAEHSFSAPLAGELKAVLERLGAPRAPGARAKRTR
jgi:23S rRNA pseudouridine955/2504/2580 synthase